MSHFWETLNDKDIALDAILTGYKGSVENMPVYDNVLGKFKGGARVLDFGCGAGRNLLALTVKYDQVYGYDYPNMLKFVSRETSSHPAIKLSSSLDQICSNTYDEVLCSLVLQHIHRDELEKILQKLTLCAPRFIIHSRTWLDFTFEEIMPILEKYFTIEEIEYQKDPNSEENDHFIGVFIPKG